MKSFILDKTIRTIRVIPEISWKQLRGNICMHKSPTFTLLVLEQSQNPNKIVEYFFILGVSTIYIIFSTFFPVIVSFMLRIHQL